MQAGFPAAIHNEYDCLAAVQPDQERRNLMTGILERWPFLSAFSAKKAVMGEQTQTEVLLERELQAGRILDEYGTGLLRFAYSYVHNLADAQELVQDTLVRYLDKAPEFENEDARKAWLFRVCANLAKNRLRFNARRAHGSLDVLLERELKQDPDLSFVWQAVCALPEKYRSVIHLFYEEGYTTAEIASILRQKESTVRSWLSRGRSRLKDILLREYDFE